MPAFKEALASEEIWQIITYMRAGFPALDAAGRK
jgi:mono/diheme cytochrome c family protein